MQKLVLPALENSIIKRRDKRILLAGLYAAHSVSVVKSVGARLFLGFMHERLTCAVDTAAGTSHYFDEIKVIPSLHALNEFLGIAESADHADMQRFFAKWNINFLYALQSANALVLNTGTALIA